MSLVLYQADHRSSSFENLAPTLLASRLNTVQPLINKSFLAIGHHRLVMSQPNDHGKFSQWSFYIRATCSPPKLSMVAVRCRSCALLGLTVLRIPHTPDGQEDSIKVKSIEVIAMRSIVDIVEPSQGARRSYMGSVLIAMAVYRGKFNANERTNNRHIQSTNLRRLRLSHTYSPQRDTGQQELQCWQPHTTYLELRHGCEGKHKSTVAGCKLSGSIGN